MVKGFSTSLFCLIVTGLIIPGFAQANPLSEPSFLDDFQSTSNAVRSRVREGIPLGNPASRSIGPYRRELIARLAQNWTTTDAEALPTILITLDHDGKLVAAALFDRSGTDKLDKAALHAATVTTYPPLPDWYKGEQLTFKINMSSVKSVQGQAESTSPKQP